MSYKCDNCGEEHHFIQVGPIIQFQHCPKPRALTELEKAGLLAVAKAHALPDVQKKGGE